jgi:hypothetical protein
MKVLRVHRPVVAELHHFVEDPDMFVLWVYRTATPMQPASKSVYCTYFAPAVLVHALLMMWNLQCA